MPDFKIRSIYKLQHSGGRLRLILVFLILFLGSLALILYAVQASNGLRSGNGLADAVHCQGAAQSINPVAGENLCPGTTAWRPDHPLGAEHAIEGFSDPISIDVGKRIKLYVSTTAPSYSLQIFRLGWYQGSGGRLMETFAQIRGRRQPAATIDPITRTVSCSNWQDPVVLNVPTNWVSGVYLAKLLSSQGYLRYIYFVVRNDTSDAPILFQTSVLTYEAYNLWGGYSLYRGLNSQGQYVPEMRSYVVSFDRPFERGVGEDFASPYNPSAKVSPLAGIGLGDFPLYSEYNMLRWMERNNYNVTYSTDIDTDMHGSLLLNHRLYLSVGHDEYWSTAMRAAVTQARDRGVSLGFFGGNDVYWHVRMQSSPLGPDREIICYKPGYYKDHIVDPLAAVNPREATVLWQDKPLNEPEDTLLGERYGGGVQTSAPLVLTRAAQPFMQGTTLHAGSALAGLVGGEYDRLSSRASRPAGLIVLAASPLTCLPSSLCPKNGSDIAEATVYTTVSGARVFDAGTFLWGWGLDGDAFYPHADHHTSTPAFQRFTANLLMYLLKS